MVYCAYCSCEVDVEVDDANGFSCCVQCGRVLEDTAFSSDVVFAKDAGGESTVVGQFVNESGQARGLGRIHGGKIYSYQADSHEKAQQRGRYELAHIADMLGVKPREESIESSHRLYKLALQRGFTRGRRTNQVAAACLYLVCRQDAKPFLLIDFSDALQVNVFVLGAVFLQLAKLLRLEEHPMFNKPVDPSLYIHRFADRLGFGRAMHAVASTALHLVASMKRDWIQTGRRPSGICGASLYIAAHIHGFERTKRDVVSVVHVGEATLSKRLTEFTTTTAGELTAEEFEKQLEEIEGGERRELEAAHPSQVPAAMLEYGCEHRRLGATHFAHGMCRSCFLEFFKATGGMAGGANPPAFQAARAREQAQALKEAQQAEQGTGGELLALPAPGDTKEEGNEAGQGAAAFEREEREIADEMAHALEGSEMQPFAALLSSHEGAGGAGASALQRKPPARRKRKAPAHEGEGDGEVGGAAKGQQKGEEGGRAQQRQHQPQQQEEEAGRAEGGGGAAAAAEMPVVSEIAKQLTQQSGRQRRQAAAVGGSQDTATDEAAATEPQEGGPAGPGERAAGADALAIMLVPGAGPLQQQQQQAGEEEEGDDDGRLSDISDSEIGHYLADEAEVQVKEEIWNLMNADWLEKQAAKQAAREAAERARLEEDAEAEAAAAAGIEYKRKRGRPSGSRAKAKADEPLAPAETPQEAALRMLDHKKLSSKINYNVLAELFEDSNTAGGAAGDIGEEGEGAAVSAALREREAAEAEHAGLWQQRQAQALEAEKGRRRAGGSAGLGGLLSAGFGLSVKGGGSTSLGGLGVGSRLGGSRPLGTLRDLGGKGKRVRFAGE